MSEKLKILVVDDDDFDRFLIKKFINQSALETDIVEAIDAFSTYSALSENEFDCVFLDCRLSGLDGLDVLAKISQENLTQAPVIMLSGLSDEGTKLKYLEAGAQNYLDKSVMSSDYLVTAINDALI